MPIPAQHELEALLSPAQVIADPARLVVYEIDAGLDRARPDGVAFPVSADEVARLVAWAAARGVPLVARGAGTGLAGGAVAERGGLIVDLSRMRAVLSLDAPGRAAVVQPGVVNQQLDERARAEGLYFPPDPSSGRSSTIGGNIGNNAGGPHCFKYGVTTNYVTGLDVVLADGRRVRLGGGALDYPEYDFVGLTVGGEGTLGIVTSATLRLVRSPPAVRTLMAAFDTVEAAGEAVSAIIARGLVPATMEMMDQRIVRIVEDYAPSGLPVDAGAVLIVEVDGYEASVQPQIDEVAAILRERGARELRLARTDEERNAIWYARKSAAGAMARLAPAYYLVDGTVPRSKLAPALAEVNGILAEHELRAGHVFHAGDGNLHPLILIDNPRDEALVTRVLEAGRRILEVCVGYDGSITGEHGVGMEKRAFMPLMYSPDELDVMREIKELFDPAGILNPGKVLPPADEVTRGQGSAVAQGQEDTPQLTVSPGQLVTPTSAQEAAAALRDATAQGLALRLRGGGTQPGWLPPAGATLSTAALRGVSAYAPDDLYVTVGAGTPLGELQAELARDRLWAPLVAPWPESTVGGIVSAAANAPIRMRYGGVRDLVLAATVALPGGRVIRAGRPVVKNVAGYDLPKLFVGAHGTLGLLTDVTLKLAPLPRARASLFALVGGDELERALRLCARLMRASLVASSLLLFRRPASDDRRPGAEIQSPEIDMWRSAAAGQWSVVYTAEGLPGDVRVELAEARAALRAEGAAGFLADAPVGAELWAAWMRELRDAAPSQAGEGWAMRVGVPPGELPALLREVDSWPAPHRLSETSLMADIAAGLLFLRNLPGPRAAESLRQAAQARGGYAVTLGAQSKGWGHAPQSIELMRALKRRWDPAGILNPGAFLV